MYSETNEDLYLTEEVRLAKRFDKFVGEGPKLRRSLQAVEKVAPTDITVLIVEETATGEEPDAQPSTNCVDATTNQ